jgi:hypothetical protein
MPFTCRKIQQSPPVGDGPFDTIEIDLVVSQLGEQCREQWSAFPDWQAAKSWSISSENIPFGGAF